ncbi:MAG: sulfite exporter TauE/SafE family protein [Pirellulales bacterium]|nr:sulfite exporter TauE/SafE family protein [Pirellulales bacterium]
MIATYVLLILAAAAAGAINSVAGGGTLLTFPALYAVLGAGPQTALAATAGVIANATSTVALVPGSAASMWGYRRELASVSHWAWLLLPPSFLGGLLGSLLVVIWPDQFDALIPWLILTAALLFALQPAITRWTGIGRPHAEPTPSTQAGIVVLQFLISVYGGYFGAGIGILMLSGLALMGLADIHAMNGLKTLLNCAINGVSVAVFVSAGVVDWPLAAMMAVAAIVGGYGGARVARRLDRNLVRRGVVTIGLALAGWYFYKQLAG